LSTKILYAFLPCMLYDLPISASLITLIIFGATRVLIWIHFVCVCVRGGGSMGEISVLFSVTGW
jgi:hypothetical protein